MVAFTLPVMVTKLTQPLLVLNAHMSHSLQGFQTVALISRHFVGYFQTPGLLGQYTP